MLLFLDSIEEVMAHSAQSHSDPDFAARIDVIQVRNFAKISKPEQQPTSASR